MTSYKCTSIVCFGINVVAVYIVCFSYSNMSCGVYLSIWIMKYVLMCVSIETQLAINVSAINKIQYVYMTMYS